MKSEFDIAIIGAGVEKEEDAGFGTSSRNSGVLHAGFNYKPGTLRAILNVQGNAAMDRICRELKVKIRRISSCIKTA